MKIKSLAKALPLLVGSVFAVNANAGVVATSYLEINDLFIEIDLDGDGVSDVDPVDLTDFISILNGTREGNTNATYGTFGAQSDSAVAGATGTADAQLVCSGPSCGGLGLSNNGQSVDFANLVHDTSSDYAVSDEDVSGSAIGGGASGFTYGDVGISQPTNKATASSQIFNNLLTSLTLQLQQSARIRFVGSYDVYVDSVITPDITSDNSLKATASAEASFNTKLTGVAGTGATAGTVLNDGVSFSDFAFDIPGLGDLTKSEGNDVAYVGGWSDVLSAGVYQLEVAQDSDVQASLVPEPGMLAVFGLGLVGLGMRMRRKN